MCQKLLFVLLIFMQIICANAQVKETKTDWNSIKNSEENITLNFVKTWRGNIQADIDSLLAPNDICMDKEGNYYLLDNSIFVYNKNGKFLKKIGKRSQGNEPGGFSSAFSLAIDSEGNLAVTEYLKGRLQLIFKDNKIKPISIPNVEFGNVVIDEHNRLVLQGGEDKEGAPKLLIYDYDGKQIGSIGKINSVKDENGNPDRSEYLYAYCTDKEENFYICYKYLAPVIEKHSPSGELVAKFNFELSTPHGKPPEKGVDPNKKINSGPRAIAADSKGNVYVVAQKNEIFNRDRDNLEVMGKSYQLIVFDNNGNLKGSKALEFYALGIRIYGDHLFIKDAGEQAIHEYIIGN